MKKLVALLICLTLMLSLAACGGQAAPAATTAPASENSGSDAPAESASSDTPAQQPIEIMLTTTDPTGCPTVLDLEKCAEEIYEKTDGMINIHVYPDGQMLVYAEGVEAMMSNANLFLVATPSYLVDYVPVMSTLVSPYLFSSRDVAAAFFDSEYFDGIEAECEEAGFHVICNDGLIGYRSVCANAPVQSVADVQKLALRISSGDVMVKLFTELKCNYTVMSFSDVFNALQTGAIDGLECVPLTITANSLYDAMSPMYYSRTNHILDCYGIYAGIDFWNSIPEQYREIIQEVLGNWGKIATADTVAQEETEIYPAYEAHGVSVIDLSDEAMAEFREIGESIIYEQERGEEVLAAVAEIEASLKG